MLILHFIKKYIYIIIFLASKILYIWAKIIIDIVLILIMYISNYKENISNLKSIISNLKRSWEFTVDLESKKNCRLHNFLDVEWTFQLRETCIVLNQILFKNSNENIQKSSFKFKKVYYLWRNLIFFVLAK